ncbi:MAG: hypothetical protein ABIJ59_11475 [Pseudomonadota bacterium]
MKKIVTFILIISILAIGVNGFSYENQKTMATGIAYFDIASGHKYLKNSDNTYTEYTRKGEVFKSAVPNTQPHLSSSKTVDQIPENAYMVYKNYKKDKPVLQVLKTSAPQPAGSLSMQILISAKQLIHKNMGLGYSSKTDSTQFDGTKNIVSGKTYLDLSTGHRYIKNSDNTYTEYTKKGLEFKIAVPNTQTHLSSNNDITQIHDDSYLVYTQYKDYKPASQVLLSTVRHPENWRCRDALVSLHTSKNGYSQGSNLSAGESNR